MTKSKDWDNFMLLLHDTNKIKEILCMIVPGAIFFYLAFLWFEYCLIILTKLSDPTTIDEVVIYIGFFFGVAIPLYLMPKWGAIIGWNIGRLLKIFKVKTPMIYFDDLSFNVSHMPQEERDNLKNLLEKYRVKTLKEKKAEKKNNSTKDGKENET